MQSNHQPQGNPFTSPGQGGFNGPPPYNPGAQMNMGMGMGNQQQQQQGNFYQPPAPMGNTGFANPNQMMQQTQPRFPFKSMIMSLQHGIYVKQKFEFLEAVTGCESGNKYYIYELAQNGKKKKGKKLVKCKEKSNQCGKQCLSSSDRPFKMECKNLFDGDDLCLQMRKPYKMTFMCFNRPKMDIFTFANGQEQYLGKVVDNYDFCNYSFSLFNSQSKKLFHVEASCNQLGFFCSCPCGPCEKIIFRIWRGDKEQELQPLIKKGKSNYAKNAIGDADNFIVPFPPNATYEERVMLMATSLFIDYMMFESSASSNEKTNRYEM